MTVTMNDGRWLVCGKIGVTNYLQIDIIIPRINSFIVVQHGHF